MQAAVPESREDWAKLAEVAEKWTAAEPNTAEAWYTLGVALENLKSNELASKAFNQAYPPAGCRSGATRRARHNFPDNSKGIRAQPGPLYVIRR